MYDENWSKIGRWGHVMEGFIFYIVMFGSYFVAYRDISKFLSHCLALVLINHSDINIKDGFGEDEPWDRMIS